MAGVAPHAKVFFKQEVFGAMAMEVAEIPSAVLALTVATQAAATTVGGATGRMVTITRANDNTAHLVHVENIIGVEDIAVVIDKP